VCHSANYTASQPGRHFIFIVTSMKILCLALRNFIIFVGFAHLYGQLAVSRWPALAEAQVLYQGSPCEVCGGNNGTGTDSLRTRFFAISYHSKTPMFVYNLGEWTVDPLETAKKRDLRAPRLKTNICFCTLIRPRVSHFLVLRRCGRGIGFGFLLTSIGWDL